MSAAKVYRKAKTVYLTPTAVAEHFGVSGMTIYRLIHDGELIAHRVGRSFRISVAELKRYEDATKHHSEGVTW